MDAVKLTKRESEIAELFAWDTMVRVFRSKTATRTCRVARRKTESDPATADFNV